MNGSTSHQKPQKSSKSMSLHKMGYTISVRLIHSYSVGVLMTYCFRGRKSVLGKGCVPRHLTKIGSSILPQSLINLVQNPSDKKRYARSSRLVVGALRANSLARLS
jgi:hypothetical protein